jgi:hypothetical protein
MCALLEIKSGPHVHWESVPLLSDTLTQGCSVKKNKGKILLLFLTPKINTTALS